MQPVLVAQVEKECRRTDKHTEKSIKHIDGSKKDKKVYEE